MKPTITIVEQSKVGDRMRTSYRVEGGTLDPEWQRFARGRDVYCRITVWEGADGLGSYGGQVWPGAWPELFEAIPSSVQGGAGGYRLTAAGREALEAAK